LVFGINHILLSRRSDKSAFPVHHGDRRQNNRRNEEEKKEGRNVTKERNLRGRAG